MTEIERSIVSGVFNRAYLGLKGAPPAHFATYGASAYDVAWDNVEGHDFQPCHQHPSRGKAPMRRNYQNSQRRATAAAIAPDRPGAHSSPVLA